MAVDTAQIVARTKSGGPSYADIFALCEEVEKLTKELEDLRVQEPAKGGE